MNKKTWIAFLATAAALITCLAIYLLYNSRENEHRLRLAKESELSRKVAELGEKQAQLQTLIQQKAELEEQFNAKLTTLESTVRDYDENSKALNAKMESVLRENESLKRDVADREKKIEDLTRKVRQLESDKKSLLDTVNRSGADKASQSAAADTAAPAESGLVFDYVNPETLSSVKLGKIVVQKTSGRAARVEYVDKLYGFVVVNAGSRDGIRPEAVLNIVRDNKLIGKAVVQKVRPEVCAAVVISEWTKEEVKTGDLISRFS